MSKKNKTEFSSMTDLMEEKKKLEKKMKKIAIPCSHTNEKGKIKVDWLDGSTVRCKKCGTKFSFETISTDELNEAILTVHNAINQIKALTNDPEKEANVIKELGSLDYNLTELYELYKRTTKEFGKGNNKNKKNKKSNGFGSYGANSINFIDGRNKGKRY